MKKIYTEIESLVLGPWILVKKIPVLRDNRPEEAWSIEIHRTKSQHQIDRDALTRRALGIGTQDEVFYSIGSPFGKSPGSFYSLAGAWRGLIAAMAAQDRRDRSRRTLPDELVRLLDQYIFAHTPSEPAQIDNLRKKHRLEPRQKLFERSRDEILRGA